MNRKTKMGRNLFYRLKLHHFRFTITEAKYYSEKLKTKFCSLFDEKKLTKHVPRKKFTTKECIILECRKQLGSNV